MLPLTLALLLLSFIVLLIKYLRPPLKVPYATASVPIIGPAIRFGINPIKYLQEQRKIHGDVFCVDLLIIRITFNISPAANTQFTRKPEADLGFWKVAEERMGPRVKLGLNWPDWFSVSIRFMQFNLNDDETLARWSRMRAPFIKETFKRWSEQKEIDMFPESSFLVLSSVLVSLLGQDFYDRHGPELARLNRQLERLMQHPLLTAFPRWMSPQGRQAEKIERRFDELIQAEIERRRIAEEKEPGSVSNGPDYLSDILRRMGFTKFIDVIPAHIMSTLIGAHTNASASFAWMTIHALSTPEIYTQMQKEHDEKSEKRPYLNGCLREIGRLYTNMMMLRKVGRQPYTLVTGNSKTGPLHLPVNEYLAISPAIIARDTNVYGPDASSYYPERYIKEAPEEHAARVKRHEWMQWGGGLHACKGEKFAKSFILNDLWGTFMREGYRFEAVGGFKMHDEVQSRDTESLLKNNRRNVDEGGTNIVATWAEENLGELVYFPGNERV